MDLGEGAQVGKLLVHELQGAGLPLLGLIECLDVLLIGCLQAVDERIGAFGIFLVQIFSNLHQCVGGARHG